MLFIVAIAIVALSYVYVRKFVLNRFMVKQE